MLYNALSIRKNTPKITRSLWDFVTLPGDRATAIGNMHKKSGTCRACRSGDILVDRQTHIQAYSLQYFATAHEVEVTIIVG